MTAGPNIATKTAPFRVSIVEDDAGVRAGLERLFNESREFKCASSYPSAESAMAKLLADKPDVVLMDINLPGRNGIECVRHLKEQNPAMLVVMLTVYEDTEMVFQALQAGAIGYLLKRTPPQQLIEAVMEVLEGGAPITSHIARKVVEAFHPPPARPTGTMVELSAREREVLELLAKGFLVKEIAAKLAVGFGTVRTYVRRIYEKLHVQSRSQAIAKYFRAGEPPLRPPPPG
ncbi:MAG TPA: response regulator transcription factor [Clostridia bacterium]|nr:response regulator transcription factor [Clostridia bacterium]